TEKPPQSAPVPVAEAAPQPKPEPVKEAPRQALAKEVAVSKESKESEPKKAPQTAGQPNPAKKSGLSFRGEGRTEKPQEPPKKGETPPVVQDITSKRFVLQKGGRSKFANSKKN